MDEEQLESFKKLVDIMCSPPVLALPQLGLHYSVDTDASVHVLGGDLFQTHNNEERQEQKPLGYWSRTLTAPERNYSATERECLVVVWALQILRPYLLYESFTVYTGHHSLRWLMMVNDPSVDSKDGDWPSQSSTLKYPIKMERITITGMRSHF